ncbi:DUF6542 domain-containing protein [Pseudonocardia bannensis]|uniref:DUF6542 domain-containing protein n=1 Tax=Pseudonocardia bannensis TaxID=630973 RepID=A0A848DG64_9PSEU|nr:DUF6542 domain-containing protein [Pseudonocardia bannensis]NMH91544.1 hypothetical protein [Pseudonocardia bannensis]
MTVGRGAGAGPKRQQAFAGQWPVSERSVLNTVLGVPPVAAVGVALGFTALGVLIDILRLGTLGVIFQICYFAGCVLAVAWVRRRSLFGPMVQPPLLIAVAVPTVVLLVGTPGPGAGITEKLLVIGAPLINGFPTMAVTTGVAVALGAARILLQRPGDAGAPASGRPGRRPSGGAGRTGRSGSGRDAGSARTSGRATGGTRGTSRSGGTGGSRGAGARGTSGSTRDAGTERGQPEARGSGTRGRAGGAASGRRGSDAARGAGRTSTSPRRY